MSSWSRWHVLVVGTLIVPLMVTARPAQAEPIVSSIDGGYEAVSPIPPPPAPLFILTSGSVGSTIADSGLVGATITDLLIDVTGADDPSPTVILVDPKTGEGTVTITVTGPEVTTAVFTISNPASIDLDDTSGTITAGVVLAMPPTIPASVADLSLFNDMGGILTLNYSFITIQAGMVTVIGPGAAASLSIQAAAVPEPASLALTIGGLIGMAGMWYMRRR